MKSYKPGKQRKKFFNAAQHKKRKWLASHLEENLMLKYDKRALPVIEGDTVKVMRGSYKGHEDKVVNVNVKKNLLEIEGITMAKADGNKIPKPIHPSNILITKLNLTDKWRRKKLERGLSSDTKKEIEKEAEEQIKEQEDQKRIEEERIKEEERKREEQEKEEEEKPEEKEKPEKKEPEKKEKKKTEGKKSGEKKQTGKKKTSEEKPKKSKKTTKGKKTATKKQNENKKTTKKKKKTTKKSEKGEE